MGNLHVEDLKVDKTFIGEDTILEMENLIKGCHEITEASACQGCVLLIGVLKHNIEIFIQSEEEHNDRLKDCCLFGSEYAIKQTQECITKIAAYKKVWRMLDEL